MRAVLLGAAGWDDDRGFAGRNRVADFDPGHPLGFDFGGSRRRWHDKQPRANQRDPIVRINVTAASTSDSIRLTVALRCCGGHAGAAITGAMKFTTPLIPGTLVQRYKRFLCDVTLDSGETITATCPNTGSMKGLTAPGSRVWLSESDSPTRKYRHTWELIENDIGQRPDAGRHQHQPPERRLSPKPFKPARSTILKGFGSLRREVKYGVNSRIDILLEGGIGGRIAYVEIKNVHLMRAAGPRRVSRQQDRARRQTPRRTGQHGRRRATAASCCIWCSGPTRRAFDLARDIDPAYAAAFVKAKAAGVEMLAYRCRLTPEEITLDKEIPITLRQVESTPSARDATHTFCDAF